MTPKIYAFIDSQNLNLGVRSQGWKLDYAKFRLFLRNKYQVTKAFLFIGNVPGNESLYAYLQKCGYLLVLKPTLVYHKNEISKTKGNVDAELVLHSMIEFKHYDKAIIISGDDDFHCLIEYLDLKNKLTKIIVPNHKYSSLLRKYSKYILNVNLLRKKLNLSETKKKRGIPAGN